MIGLGISAFSSATLGKRLGALLLDTLPGALGAWGVVPLRTAHAGPLLEEAGGVITRLFDQSLSDRDGVQASAPDRPAVGAGHIQVAGGKRIDYPNLPEDYDLHVLIRVSSSTRSIIFTRGGNTDAWGLVSEVSTSTTQLHPTLSAVNVYVDAEEVTTAQRAYVHGRLVGTWRVASALGMPSSQPSRAIGDFPTFELGAEVVALVAYPTGLHSIAEVTAALRGLIPA